jgi:hypothetical protein
VADNTLLLALLFPLAVALVASLVVLLRRKPPRRAEGDPARSLMQRDSAQFEEKFELGQRHMRNAQAAFGEAAEPAGRIAGRMEQFARIAKGPAPEGETVSR